MIFSALKHMKTYLRSTMSEQCLNDMALLSIEKKVAGSLSLNDVVDRLLQLRITLH